MSAAGVTADGVAKAVDEYVKKLRPVVAEQREHWRNAGLPIFEEKVFEWETASARFITLLDQLSQAATGSSAGYQTASADGAAVMASIQSAPFNGVLGGPTSAGYQV
ncbi:hypothetical protein [Phytohabitans rumicis]|nr:hypothetical protein [Phytohabitans rumicis]